MKNSVLRPACLSDVPQSFYTSIESPALEVMQLIYEPFCAIRRLYDAEWRKRGFLRSP